MKLVSAIITTHNRLDLLKRAVESVFSQTYRNIELIVVDDHSIDGTYEYCQSQPFRYIYISPGESRGGNYARNQGIRAAKGEYVAFLDDDDYWLPEKIEKQVKLLESKHCELVTCTRKDEIVKLDGTIQIVKNNYVPQNGDMSKKILFGVYTTTSLMLVKKQALLDIGFFDEDLKFWQEYELTIRLAQRTHFYCVNEDLAVYRVNIYDSNRLTNKYNEWIKAVSYIFEKHKHLYNRLTFIEHLMVENYRISEAAHRAQRSGLIWKSFYNYILLYTKCLPVKIYYRIK